LLNLAVEALNAPFSEGEDMRYLFGVAYTNRMVLQKIDAASRLAKQAGKRASEALSRIEKKEEPAKK
jgi:hypothetical protein